VLWDFVDKYSAICFSNTLRRRAVYQEFSGHPKGRPGTAPGGERLFIKSS